jgi:hypothetical protein
MGLTLTDAIEVMRVEVIKAQEKATRLFGKIPDSGLVEVRRMESLEMAHKALQAMVLRPIEEAPKDGTPILGWMKGWMTACHWNSGYSVEGAVGMKPYWQLVVAGDFAEEDAWYPTHWLPMPIVSEQKEGV